MKNSSLTRRNFIKASAAVGIQASIPMMLFTTEAEAVPLTIGDGPTLKALSDPEAQPMFSVLVPNAFAPAHRITKLGSLTKLKEAQELTVVASQYIHETGLVDENGVSLKTPVWGYGKNQEKVSWPGPTIETYKDTKVEIMWKNKLLKDGVDFSPLPHLLPVDENLHWAYGLHGYKQYSIEKDGVPIVPHVHGSHVDTNSDGNPEYFFSPNWKVRGPRWIQKKYTYDNTQEAGCLWYHDHCLGMTRLNVYAGLAGFYIIRDDEDTGRRDNPLLLPAEEYELGYVIQDRMFKANGELFFPAFPDDPAYNDFIWTERDFEILPPDLFPNGGPSILPEFFGDHIVVNGKIWPKADVEPRQYRMRILNGSDSRFLAIRFRQADAEATTLDGAGDPIPFSVIGSDQGLAAKATEVVSFLLVPGGRTDIIVNFDGLEGSRIIMDNIAGDSPFTGALGDELDADDLFPYRQTDRIMAFDVNQVLSDIPDEFVATAFSTRYEGNTNRLTKDTPRKLALFEGRDEFDRLQPMLGTAEPVEDMEGNTEDMYGNTLQGTMPWHGPITENPELHSTEIWEIYNATDDAHPVHVHLVNFEILNREDFEADVIMQKVMQHDGSEGKGFYLENIKLVPNTLVEATGVEKAPKDMVTSYPGQVTRIKMTFDRPGRYVWHCHILSHEYHDMMRPMYVGDLPLP